MKLKMPKITPPKGMTSDAWKTFFRENKVQLLLIGAAIVALLVLLSFGWRSIAVIVGLILLGTGSTLLITFSGVHFGHDFTIFGGIVGAYLFGPWIGALIVASEYYLLSRTVSPEMIDFPAGAWYIIVAAFILPKVLFLHPILALTIGSALAELGTVVYWVIHGFPIPHQLFNGLMKILIYIFMFVYVLPEIQSFLGA